MTEPKRLARIAGALYLLMFVLGGIAHLGVRTERSTAPPGFRALEQRLDFAVDRPRAVHETASELFGAEPE